MKSYNVIAEIKAAPTKARVEELVDQLAEFHPAVSRTDRGNIEVIITIGADGLPQASRLALNLIPQADSVHAMTTEEFDARNGVPRVPDLMSVSQAAEALGITRAGVLDRIDRGTLSARKVGTTYVIPTAAVIG